MSTDNKEKTKVAAATGKKQTSGDVVIAKFTDMVIQRLKEVKASDWKKGWTNGKGAFLGAPMNIAGRNYSGSNSFFLQMDTAMNGYKVPVYMTFLQAMKEGVKINKGEQSMPVMYWDHYYKDKNGKKLDAAVYHAMTKEQQKECSVSSFLRSFRVFNVGQTNLQEVKPELYDKILARYQGPQMRDAEGMFVCPSLDRMFEKQEWICRILNQKIVDGAFYSPSRDLVVVPKKEQFNIGKNAEEIYMDGMEYYSSALHEMCHSTGAANRLNREKGTKFGDAKYAKEEMVAELTAAMVGNALGFDKRILTNNLCYVDGWINAMRESPEFVKNVMADVTKASHMIFEKIDEQKIALGEKPILTESIQKAKDKGIELTDFQITPFKAPIGMNIEFDNLTLNKKVQGDKEIFSISASYGGQSLGEKMIRPIDGKRYFMMPDGGVKDRFLQDIASKQFVQEVFAIRENKEEIASNIKAEVHKNNKGEYVLEASVEDQKLAPKIIERKTGYDYLRAKNGVDDDKKRMLLSKIVHEAYGDELKIAPKKEQAQNKQRSIKL